MPSPSPIPDSRLRERAWPALAPGTAARPQPAGTAAAVFGTWREFLQAGVGPGAQARHWMEGAADKPSTSPSHDTPLQFLGHKVKVSAPSSMFGEFEEWGEKRHEGTTRSYCAVSGRWGVDFPAVSAWARRLMDKNDIRKYGPQNMRLRTTKDVDGPDWHLTEYAATARVDRAWYFLDPDCGPQQSKDGMHDRGLGVGWRQLMPRQRTASSGRARAPWPWRPYSTCTCDALTTPLPGQCS
jgi:hypothetical protein